VHYANFGLNKTNTFITKGMIIIVGIEKQSTVQKSSHFKFQIKLW